MAKSKKGGESRVVVTLECKNCRKNNEKYVSRYSTSKNKKNQSRKLEVKKYCRYERKHQSHVEIR